MPKNKVQHREGRSLARLFADCAAAGQSELACYDGRCPKGPDGPLRQPQVLPPGRTPRHL